MSRRTRWRLATEALAVLVREDYPPDLRLSEIARTWGIGLTPDHLAALRSVESDLPTEVGLRFREDPPDVGEEQGALGSGPIVCRSMRQRSRIWA